jgi:ABC-type multidrug transport system ATPase subunit
MARVLSLRSLQKSYRSGVSGCSAVVRVLRHVNLDVTQGEIVGVAGAPGAGKSTLLLCAAGLLRPDAGTVERPRSGTYVAVFPPAYRWMAVLDMISLVTRAYRPRAVRDALDRVGLGYDLARPVGTLSGDALARLHIACLLVTLPVLALIDGPISALIGLLPPAGVTVVLAARDARQAASLATRVVVLADGVVQAQSRITLASVPRLG